MAQFEAGARAPEIEAGPADGAVEPLSSVRSEVEWFFASHYASVVRTAYVILQDRGRAEDVAQEAFTQLVLRWRRVSRYERPEAWVRRVAIRLATRSLKRERIRGLLERSVVQSPSHRPGDPGVMWAISELPPQQRAAVALFYLEDRRVGEIAGMMGCSASTVKVHLHRARKRLAKLLGEEAGDGP